MNYETGNLPSRIRICAGLAGNGEILAKEAAINRRTLETYISGQAEPKISKIVAIAKAVGVSIDWLATGEGEMLATSKDGIQPEPNQPGVDSVGNADAGQVSSDRIGIKPEEIDEFALIPMYDIEASAGHGAVVGEELQISQLAFRKDWLKSKGLQQNKLATLKARGDSMEPTLHDGDLLLVDTRIEKIIDDAIYIIHADHHLIVKRLQQSLDGSISIISDNQRYEKQRLSPEQAKALKIAGRVCWYGHEI